MPLQRDDDVVRGLGFVGLYAAYLEEQIDNLLFMLQPIEQFPESEQRWQTSRKIEKAKKIGARTCVRVSRCTTRRSGRV
jgi:hypothetical protein